MLFNVLLTLHIVAGCTAVLTAGVAILSKRLDIAHPWHVYSGRLYFWAMGVIFMTAIPMSLLHPNLFLFLMSIFSFYFALSGWRLARNRRGTPQRIDWTTAGVMVGTAAVMMLYGIYLLLHANTQGITLLVFGLFGAYSGYRDVNRLRAGGLRGPIRIAEHMSRMMGATIATLTAVLVTNVKFQPAFVLWLGPAVLITPIILRWHRQLRAGRRGQGSAAGTLAETA